MRAQVALVELHAFDELHLGGEALALFDGDHAVLADLVHGLGDDLADFLVLVGGTGADLGDLLGVTHGLAHVASSSVMAATDVGAALDCVGVPGGDVLQTLPGRCFGVDGRGGGAVTGILGRLAGDFLHHLSTHVLEGVTEFDFLGDGDTILGDVGGTEGLLEITTRRRGRG